ncbi:DUF389 domain-containing protein [Massilia sp. H-1]|nr:DUF389 domain-containing protein [Massilia sp. H-1]
MRGLGIFVGLSLLTSTAYFWLSPLSEAHTELLARTTPTLWDVLIAFSAAAPKHRGPHPQGRIDHHPGGGHRHRPHAAAVHGRLQHRHA